MSGQEPRQIAVVRSYDDILQIGRVRVPELEITYDILDQFTGFCEGFWSKNLAGSEHTANGTRPTKRHLSPSSFDALLAGACFDLVAVENPEKVRKLREWMERNMLKRRAPKPMLNGVQHRPVIIKLSRRHMQKLGKMSAQGRMRKMTKSQRSGVAQNAAKARWSRPIITEVVSPPTPPKVSALPKSKK